MRTTYQFRFFEVLWGFEGLAHNPNALVRYYGIAIAHWFFGTVTIVERT